MESPHIMLSRAIRCIMNWIEVCSSGVRQTRLNVECLSADLQASQGGLKMTWRRVGGVWPPSCSDGLLSLDARSVLQQALLTSDISSAPQLSWDSHQPIPHYKDACTSHRSLAQKLSRLIASRGGGGGRV